VRWALFERPYEPLPRQYSPAFFRRPDPSPFPPGVPFTTVRMEVFFWRFPIFPFRVLSLGSRLFHLPRFNFTPRPGLPSFSRQVGRWIFHTRVCLLRNPPSTLVFAGGHTDLAKRDPSVFFFHPSAQFSLFSPTDRREFKDLSAQ